MKPETEDFLRKIKKSAIVLLAMGAIGGPCGVMEIAELLEMDKKTVSKHIKKLIKLKFVHDGGGYGNLVLTYGAQLFLYTSEDYLPFLELGEKVPQNIKLGEIPPNLSTTTILINSYNDTVKDLETVQPKLAEFPPITESQETSLFLLKGLGIGKRMLDELIRLPHVNPEYIKAHIEQYKIDRKADGRIKVNMLIHRIREEDDAPEIQGNKDYTGGKYADQIES